MRWGLPSGEVWRRPIFGRMDRTAKKINPLLVIVVVMLAIIDLSCYSALAISRRHPPRPDASQPAAQPAPGRNVILPSTQG